MSAPTTFRVEAISQTQTILRWDYTGSAVIGIYRSPDGVTYTLIDTVGATVKLFNDTGLTSGTKYWYKVSDDVGATFSSVKTVVTHSCGDTGVSKKRGFALPRFKKNADAKGHNRAMRDVEDQVDKLKNQEPCCVDLVDGAIVINCQDGCDCYDVDATTNINSITFLNCDGVDPCINFKVPPSTTVGICGFPQGHDGKFSQYSGDECTKAPVNGGTNGKTVTTGPTGPPSSKPGSGKGGKGRGTPACECVPGKSGELVVKCCSSDCSMSCGSTKALNIRICGGTGPYTISGSSGLQFKKANGVAVGSGTINAGEVISVTPPTNSGSAVANTAYVEYYWEATFCTGDTPLGDNAFSHKDVGCDDVSDGCFTVADGHTHCTTASPGGMGCKSGGGGGPDCLPICTGASCNTAGDKVVSSCDNRSAGMIAVGCNPCGVSAAGKTVTVTDAQGVSVVTTLAA